MKRTLLTLTLAAQFAGTVAFAQTLATTAGTTDQGMTSRAYGSDWSTSLNSAMFGKDGTTVRSDTDLASQWEALSAADRDMVRRDCMMYDQRSGSSDITVSTTPSDKPDIATVESNGSPSAITGTQSGTSRTQPGATGTQSGASVSGSNPAMNVSMEQMERLCAATRNL